MMYTQDYDERLPIQNDNGDGGGATSIINFADPSVGGSAAGQNVYYAIYPYTRSWQILVCPSAPAYTGATYNPYQPNPNSATSYSVNGVFFDSTSLTGGSASGSRMPLSAINNPSSEILIQERYLTFNFEASYPDSAGGGEFREWMFPTQFSDNHFGGGNLLFADGHVKWQLQSSICLSEFGLVAVGSINTCGVQGNTTTDRATVSPNL